MNQLEQQGSSPGSVAGASTSASTVPSSASALHKQGGYGINRVSAFRCDTPPGCRITEIFDISELDEDDAEFSLEGPGVFAIAAVTTSEHLAVPLPEVAGEPVFPEGVPVYPMDVTDGDGNYTMCGLPRLRERSARSPGSHVR